MAAMENNEFALINGALQRIENTLNELTTNFGHTRVAVGKLETRMDGVEDDLEELTRISSNNKTKLTLLFGGLILLNVLIALAGQLLPLYIK